MIDVIVIGAGAAGLMAAYTLAQQGKKIIVLEARDRCGGRIHTVNQDPHFELGAEFIHGNLPVTLNLLQTAGIKYHHAGGEMWEYKNGSFKIGENVIPDWDKLMEKLNALQQDCTMTEFLQREFGGDEYAALRSSVNKYIAGYDTADPNKASALALKNEWQNEDEDAQYRIDGGYHEMIKFLMDAIISAGGEIYLHARINVVQWQKDNVAVVAVDGMTYYAKCVLIALPLGVLQKSTVKFEPPVPQQETALQGMGYGAIIKVLLQFKEIFWEDEQTRKLTGKDPKQMAFILSDEKIPTWWTQAPVHNNVLTGWLGGPAAAAKKNVNKDDLLTDAIQSLANIFKRSADELKNKLQLAHIVNWTADPYTCGSYAYDTVKSESSRQLLNKGIDETLFFAGEYLYSGPAMGTVEAALASGQTTANKILSIWNVK